MPLDDRGTVTDRPVIDTSVSGSSVGASAPIGAPALSYSDQATNRPFLTESRQVVGGIPLLLRHRQK
jgi:hypothetical protein